VFNKSAVAAHLNVKEKMPAPTDILARPVVATAPRSMGKQSQEITGKNLVSATVYLLPDKLELIKQICADKNRRISDLISEAVDDYLCKRR
jgi:hypothetical protein